MRRAWVPIVYLLMVAACGKSRTPADDGNRIAPDPAPAVATLAKDLPPLEPVAGDEVSNAVAPGMGCDLSVDGELLLVTGEDGGAVAKWRGRLVRLRHAGGAVEKGGRFIGEDGGDPIIDVGTPQGAGEQAGEDVTSWRVEARLSSPDSVAQPAPFAAVWSCGA